MDILFSHLLEDIFPLIPFHTIFEKRIGASNAHILYLTKMTRIFKGFRLLHYKSLIHYMKDAQMKRIQKKMLTMSKTEKFMKISDIVLFSTLLKTLRFIVIILALSFLMGVCWFILCDLQRR